MKPKYILIIDDSRDLVFAVSRRLSNAGYRVDAAFDAVQGLTVAVENKPDLIILDLGLPGGSGLDVLKRFRKLYHLCNTPVIVFTAKGKQAEKEARSSGANEYLTKPCEASLLLKTVNDVLTHSSSDPSQPEVFR